MRNHFLEKLKNKIRELFSIKRLQRKLFLLFMTVILLLSIIGFGYQWFAFNVYDGLLYETATKVARNSATRVEKEIDSIETVTYNIMADRTIQEYLFDISEAQERYEQYRIINRLMDRLHTYIFNLRYVTSITYIGTDGDQSTQGPRQMSLEEKFKTQVYEEACKANGTSVLLTAPNLQNTVIIARLIKKIDQMDFSTLGVVAIRLNLNDLILDTEQYQHYNGENLLITKDDKILYAFDKNNIDIFPLLSPHSDNHYEIKTLNGLRKFITYWTSLHTGWTYINITPYEQIFNQVLLLRSSILFVMSILIGIMAYVSIRFSRYIVTPVKLLNERIKEVEAGNFTGEPDKISGMDEIAHLRRSFEKMANELNRLITENYKNQITVKEFQYRALQAQINPHFLYNTLDSVNWLARMNNQEEIRTIVESLSKLLRNAIDERAQTITIGEELDILRSYTAIQKIRYEERLEIEVNVMPQLLKYRIPRLALQPIVENSINHALESMDGICHISVRIEEEDNRIRIYVNDNGPGISAELLSQIKQGTYVSSGNGIGLKNIKDRIMIVFDNQARMDISSGSDKGTTVFLEFPANEL